MSNIESHYTTGQNLTLNQKKTYLAGEEFFVPDMFEIWTIEY